MNISYVAPSPPPKKRGGAQKRKTAVSVYSLPVIFGQHCPTQQSHTRTVSLRQLRLWNKFFYYFKLEVPMYVFANSSRRRA